MIISLLNTTPSKHPHVKSICDAIQSDAVRWFGSQPSFITVEKEYGHNDYYINIYPQLPNNAVYTWTVMDIVNNIEAANPELNVNYLHWGWRLGDGFETVRICLSDYKPPLWNDWGWTEEDVAKAHDPDSILYKALSDILTSDELDWASGDEEYLISMEKGFVDYGIATVKIGKGFVSRALVSSLLRVICKSSPTIAVTSVMFLGKHSNGLGWGGVDITVIDEAQKIKSLNAYEEPAEEREPDIGSNIDTTHPNLLIHRDKRTLNRFWKPILISA